MNVVRKRDAMVEKRDACRLDADDKPPLEVVESLHVEKDLFPSGPHANWPHG